VVLLLLAVAEPAAAAYRNPLRIEVPGATRGVETFADPTGALRGRRIPMARSSDLVRWTYMGDAFAAAPEWLAPTAGQWAPEVRRVGDRYLLYYTATDVADRVSGEPGCDGDSAIGVASAPTPLGPWTDSGGPVVEPRRRGPGCDFKWTFDPSLIEADGGPVLYYGSYNGGVEARRLSPDALRSLPETATPITIEERYEGTYVIRRGGWYWFFGSATDCCRGPLTGYSVFAGRSRSPFGPFTDRVGAPLTASRVGGTPVISMNGNRWVGTGHNSVITDAAGQDWFVYHAIDRFDPYLPAPNPNRITKRPMLLDRLTWVGGWPSVRAGRWASDEPQPAPATPARPDVPPRDERPGRLLRAFSTEFERRADVRRWAWTKRRAGSLRGGRLRLPTQAGDIAEASNDASLFATRAPSGAFMAETKVTFDLPASGVFNFQQAGLAVWDGDDRFLKLAHVAIGPTRQTEWATEVPRPATPDGRRYGNTVVGPPARTTWLRIVRRGGDRYTAYTSGDGRRWVRGGTWRNALARPRIALFAMGGRGHTARFEYVRVHRLR
jgi:arabinan endo-1,5-alpha-L-arabinosidase